MQRHFAAPTDGRRVLALQWGYAWLTVLGVAAFAEHATTLFALYAMGRANPLIALAPRFLTAMLGAASLAFFAGLRPRWSGLTVCALFASLYALVPAIYQNNYYVLWLMLFVIATHPNEQYTPDWFLDPNRETTSAPVLVPRLIQWQIVIVYVGSVLVKLSHRDWQGHGTLIRLMATQQFPTTISGWWNIPVRALVQHRRIAAIIDVGVTGAELITPLLLIERSRRRLGFALGAALHLFMQEWLFPQMFTFAMLLGYYAFVPSGDRSVVIRFDPANRFDRAVAAIYPKIDWLARTVWSPDEHSPDLALEGTDQHRRTGFGVLRELSVLSPVPLLAFATFALAAPGTHTVFGIPRPGLENTLVAIYAVTWLPGLATPLYRRVRSHFA